MDTTDAVDSVMKGPVRMLDADVQAILALQYAEKHGIHHFPVVHGGKVTGLICTCDLEGADLKTPLGSVPHRAAVTLPREASIADAVRVMAEQSIGSVLVTEHDRVVGIVTREDLDQAGISVDDAPGFRCMSCGSVKHLKSEAGKGLLCLDCRAHAAPESPDDETGVVD